MVSELRRTHASNLATTLFALAVLSLAPASTTPARAAADDSSTGNAATFDRAVAPFFATYCNRCHDAKKQAGEFRLDILSRDFTDQTIAERWSEVLFRINAGEMPPAKEPQPKPDDLGRAVDWISSRIKEGEADRLAKRGPVTLYRLSREEYGRTVYDLLGVYFDVTMPGAFNEEPRRHGFDRIGSLLALSPSHVDRYFRAAEIVVNRAFPDQPIAPRKTLLEANKSLDKGTEKWLAEQGLAGPVRWLLWPGYGRQAFRVTEPGLYHIRVRASGLPSFRGRLPHLALWHTELKRSLVGRDVRADEASPTDVVIEAFLPEGNYQLLNESPGMLADGHTLSNTIGPFVSIAHTLANPRRPTGYKLFDDAGKPIFPLLIVDVIEAEGPIVLEADQQKREGLFPTKASDPGEARDCLRRFTERAWRRPTHEAELDRYVKIVESEVAAGESFRSAYRAALVAVLTSKNFYYLAEGSAAEKRATVDDFELASRLSYFFWNSLPDEALLAAARSGDLRKPAALQAQVVRMLADPKAARFAESFPKQWLQLHRVGMFTPDAELYPDYDKWLEECLVLESTGYFAEMFKNNLPLREFLASDWTMLNPRLALHYKLPIPAATELQRVALRAEDHRGGILTHASVLSLTSDGTRHRPVHRGVWVSEAIFGRTPPPPPPNVEPLEPTPIDKPKATIRMQLEAHATHAICASCHKNIDPLGFAFDGFDAIGRIRTHEKVAGGKGDDPPVDPSGALPDGRTYRNADEFKKLLTADADRFAEAFVEQLATYALRRVMTIDDHAEIRAIAASCKSDDYRLRSLVVAFATSDLFRKR
jgi:hypothetical protein